MAAMRTVLITLIGAQRTSDLVVDGDTNVEALLPNLLVAGGVLESARDQPGWGVALMGKQPIELQHTLEQSGVLDGAVLVLRREAEVPQDPVASPRATGGPAGSPLERTRALIDQKTAAEGRRGRLSLQLPDRALVSDGTRALERRAGGLHRRAWAPNRPNRATTRSSTPCRRARSHSPSSTGRCLHCLGGCGSCPPPEIPGQWPGPTAPCMPA
jgi:hypothetical protein